MPWFHCLFISQELNQLCEHSRALASRSAGSKMSLPFPRMPRERRVESADDAFSSLSPGRCDSACSDSLRVVAGVCLSKCRRVRSVHQNSMYSRCCEAFAWTNLKATAVWKHAGRASKIIFRMQRGGIEIHDNSPRGRLPSSNGNYTARMLPPHAPLAATMTSISETEMVLADYHSTVCRIPEALAGSQRRWTAMSIAPDAAQGIMKQSEKKNSIEAETRFARWS